MLVKGLLLPAQWSTPPRISLGAVGRMVVQIEVGGVLL